MSKRQSHWLALTYYQFDFSKSVRANADNVINIHECSSSLILSVFYIVISSRIHIIIIIIILSVLLFVFFFSFFYRNTEMANTILSTTTIPKFS